MDELKITKDTAIEELSFDTFMDKQAQLMKFDVEAKYNIKQQGIGYDHLLDRAAKSDAKSQADAAHKPAVDKLLADYFMGRKNENAEANKLIYDLAAVFDEDNKSTGSFDAILKKYKGQQINKEERKGFHFEAFKDMIDLDVITSRAIQNGKNGLSEELRHMSITEKDHEDHWFTQVPDYFDIMDVRKPPAQVVDDRLFILIKQAFDVRRTLEKQMNRRELLAFD